VKRIVAFAFFIETILAFAYAQKNRPSSENKLSIKHPITSIIKKNDSTLKIDGKVISENKNLSSFIHDLQTSRLSISYKVDLIPAFIRSFLQQLTNDKFTIANPGKDWNCCCDRNDELPNRQILCLGNGNGLFFINYLTGGIGEIGHVILIKYNGDNITDLWFGDAGECPKTEYSTIQYLLKNKYQYPGAGSL
jgi:hypothetical protein